MSHVEITLVWVGCAIGVALAVVALARRGRLSMRYALGWLGVAICIAIAGLGSGLVTRLSRRLGTSATALTLAGVVVAFLVLTVQLSITASGLTERVRELAERQAILAEALERQGSRGSPPAGDASSAVVTDGAGQYERDR